MTDPLDCALDLLRRLPPRNIAQGLVDVTTLAPDLTESLLSSVDQPLKTRQCSVTHKDHLLSEYNRDGDSYRSPWSNTFSPPLTDGAVPSPSLRKLEEAANNAFEVYRSLYYEQGISSSYFWDLENGFAAAVLFKKELSGEREPMASWDAIHVFEVIEQSAHQVANYKLTSTIILTFQNQFKKGKGQFDISGNLTRQMDQDLSFTDGHLINLGKMVEEMEFKLRDVIKNVYFDKTKDIANDVRSIKDLSEIQSQMKVQNELFAKLNARKKA